MRTSQSALWAQRDLIIARSVYPQARQRAQRFHREEAAAAMEGAQQLRSKQRGLLSEGFQSAMVFRPHPLILKLPYRQHQHCGLTAREEHEGEQKRSMSSASSSEAEKRGHAAARHRGKLCHQDASRMSPPQQAPLITIPSRCHTCVAHATYLI